MCDDDNKENLYKQSNENKPLTPSRNYPKRTIVEYRADRETREAAIKTEPTIAAWDDGLAGCKNLVCKTGLQEIDHKHCKTCNEALHHEKHRKQFGQLILSSTQRHKTDNALYTDMIRKHVCSHRKSFIDQVVSSNMQLHNHGDCDIKDCLLLDTRHVHCGLCDGTFANITLSISEIQIHAMYHRNEKRYRRECYMKEILPMHGPCTLGCRRMPAFEHHFHCTFKNPETDKVCNYSNADRRTMLRHGYKHAKENSFPMIEISSDEKQSEPLPLRKKRSPVKQSENPDGCSCSKKETSNTYFVLACSSKRCGWHSVDHKHCIKCGKPAGHYKIYDHFSKLMITHGKSRDDIKKLITDSQAYGKKLISRQKQ